MHEESRVMGIIGQTNGNKTALVNVEGCIAEEGESEVGGGQTTFFVILVRG